MERNKFIGYSSDNIDHKTLRKLRSAFVEAKEGDGYAGKLWFVVFYTKQRSPEVTGDPRRPYTNKNILTDAEVCAEIEADSYEEALEQARAMLLLAQAA